MSRILRRPMFRGGPVSSYGTGIASGLANGGRVGYATDQAGGIVLGKDLQNFRSLPSYNPKEYKFYTGGDDKRYVTDYIPKSAEDLRIFQDRSKWEVPSIEDIDQKIKDEVETIDFNRIALDSSGQISGDLLPTQFIETEAGQEKRKEELLAERAKKIDQMREYGIVVPGEGHPSEGIDATWSSKEPQKGVEVVKKEEEVDLNGNEVKKIEKEESTTISADDIRAQAALFDELLNEGYEKDKKSAQISDASDYALKFFQSTVGEGKGMKEAAGDVAGYALAKPSKTEAVKAGKKKTKQTATVMAINEALSQGKSDRELKKILGLADYKGDITLKNAIALATYKDSKNDFYDNYKENLKSGMGMGRAAIFTVEETFKKSPKILTSEDITKGVLVAHKENVGEYFIYPDGKITTVVPKGDGFVEDIVLSGGG